MKRERKGGREGGKKRKQKGGREWREGKGKMKKEKTSL